MVILIDRLPRPEGDSKGMPARAYEIVAIFNPITHSLTILDPLPPSVKAAGDYSEVRAAIAQQTAYDSHHTHPVHPIAPGNDLVDFLRGDAFDQA